MSKYAIIVAGGSGSRMLSEVPKQFMLLNGQPIIIHTVKRFLAVADLEIVVVLPEAHLDRWLAIKNTYFQGQHGITETIGGSTRFQSVKNGLAKISGEAGYVSVHDAVRPLIKTSLINESFAQASRHDSAVLVVKSKDSLRKIDGESNQAIDREKIYQVQTPQTFELALFRKAYEQPESNAFTDDASVIESHGHRVHTINGDYANLKITTPEDLVIAESLLKFADL
jgi:2-C-methyl-D-erythritol 4-phosphate cytidylyltransferase